MHNRFFTVQITNYLRNRKHLPSYRNTSRSSREREMFCGNTSRTRVFPQPCRILLSFHECFYLTIRLFALDFYLNNRVFLSSPTFSVRSRSSVGRVTVDLIRRSWVRFSPRSKDFFFTSCGSLIPFTRANAQWVIHGFN